MFRSLLLTTLTGLLLGTTSQAQKPALRFRWLQGQVLTYQVDHMTAVTEVVSGVTSETRTQLGLTKRWQVLSVDATGVATLQLSLAALRLEMTTPGGATLVFDSREPDKATPALRAELSRYVGQPLAVLRLDPQGQVVEVKESKHGPASRFESELPFVVTLPAAGPQQGQQWQRTYRMTIDPPQGTGEKYDALQTYTCKSVEAGTLTLTVETVLKALPDSLLDRVPLLQMQPTGEVVFDMQNGRLASALLRIDKELAGHQGAGSSYKFQSRYQEKFVAGP
jgi:hypothetical protein